MHSRINVCVKCLTLNGLTGDEMMKFGKLQTKSLSKKCYALGDVVIFDIFVEWRNQDYQKL